MRFIKSWGWPIVCGILAGVLWLQWQPQNDAGGGGYASAVRAAAPAVVNINTRKEVTKRAWWLNDSRLRQLIPQRQKEFNSLGSGVIVRDDGYIVTNAHVINGADEIDVLLADGRSALARVVGVDRESDLAVLHIPYKELATIQYGSAHNSKVGDIVLAIGNPFGVGQSVSQGIVSAKGRYGMNLNTFEDYIQTDAAINPGNSGGALVDTHGRLLGINSAIYSNQKTGTSIGIGLAIPVDTVDMAVRDIIEHGHVMRGWLGIEVREHNEGVFITRLSRGGPAELAGMEIGDRLVSIDGSALLDGYQAMNNIAKRKPGSNVTIDVDRYGQKVTLTASVGIRAPR